MQVSEYKNLPETPGIYLMKDRQGRVLYVGKAANLRHRVASYFTRLPAGRHGPHDSRIEQLVRTIHAIDYEKTDTVIEALIKEAACIKELRPPFNIREKDDKSFLYVEITKDEFPRILLSRKRGTYGPFTSAKNIREALRIIRKIFPYNTHTPEEVKRMKRPCFEYEVGMCPGTCLPAERHGLPAEITKQEYKKTIRNIKLFFEGKKQKIIQTLKKEMAAKSATLDFETAQKLKRQLFALEHIRDVALIKEPELEAGSSQLPATQVRIEGYDISNISGTSATGSMVVFAGGVPDKNEYRKFKIKTVVQPDDTGMLKEVLRRRFKRTPPSGGWPLPHVLLIDGGKGQVHAAERVLAEFGLAIPVVGIAKGAARKRNDIIGTIPKGVTKETLIRVRNEAHRFAIAYHKKLRHNALFSSA